MYLAKPGDSISFEITVEIESTKDPNKNEACEQFLECTNKFMKNYFAKWPGCVPQFLTSNSEDYCDGVYDYPDQDMYNVSTNFIIKLVASLCKKYF